MQQMAAGTLAATGLVDAGIAADAVQRQQLPAQRNTRYIAPDKPTAYADATTYNNFYEFGTDKGDPAMNAGTLSIEPISVNMCTTASLAPPCSGP